MAAPKTVPQLSQSHNSIVPRHGVLTLFGYGIEIRVDRGHLVLDDGIGADRRHFRLPRVGHGLKRLVVVGADGFVSLAALRWLADQKASFVMLERDGTVLASTGPVRASDARLRRAQGLAHSSETALRIARELIRQKLSGQEQVARNKLLDSSTGDVIAQFRAELPTAESIATVRLIESQAALAYWSAFRNLPISFPKNDLARVPDHWRTFGARISPLTGSPRLAANPPNAILNYLYAVLEAEARLAAAALGLDPGLGVLHVDAQARDSLACDLMEAARPQVDAYLVDWIVRQPLKREWFFEERNGNCRLMDLFAVRLSETAPTWGRAVAPIVRKKICEVCGAEGIQNRYCRSCAVEVSRDNMAQVALIGHSKLKTSKVKARISNTLSDHAVANSWWSPSSLPAWLNEEYYVQKIQPRLSVVKVREIAVALNVSKPYSAFIRSGRRRPHPRHWQVLAELVGLNRNNSQP
jgi:CRISPR-associated endonuclease Cas1